MMRLPIWATAFVLVAGASLAAPSVDVPMREPQPERPTLSAGSSLEEFVLPIEEELAAEGVQIARKAHGGGGHRGGARSKSRGGFKNGNKRHAQRHAGEPGRPGRPGDPGGLRGGNVDRNVNVHGGGDWDDDDDEARAALLGGVVGLGVGAMINDGDDE